MTKIAMHGKTRMAAVLIAAALWGGLAASTLAKDPQKASTRTFVTANAVSDTSPTLASVVPTDTVVPADGKGLRLNFRGVPLDTVLDYLSRAAGFIIVREASVQGRVDVVSHDPLSKEEAVALLNNVLNKQGFAAIQNDRTLTIVTRDEARKRDIPVHLGRDPQKVTKTGDMVTQVIPVTHANVTQLIKDIEPLLPSYAVMTANESSSAVVLTATQTDVHRIMEIIQALDGSMSEISSIKVFHLLNADATEAAKMVNDLFKSQNGVPPTNNNNGGRRGGGFPFPMFGGMGNNQGNNDSKGTPAAQIVAVADTRTNCVVISASEEAMPMLEKLLNQIDSTNAEAAEVRVFPLQYADAQNMATMIEDVFNGTSSSQNTNTNQMPGFFPRFMGPMQPQQQDTSKNRKGNEDPVNAVADVRTNAVVVNSPPGLMDQIAQMVERLDNNPAKEHKVFVYKLQYADPLQTAQLLAQMFGDQASQSAMSSAQRNTTNNNNSLNSSNNSSRTSGGSVPNGLGSMNGGGF